MNKNNLISLFDVSTRRKRRESTITIAAILKNIQWAEAEYRDRIPDNMQGGDAYIAADEAVDAIDDAICAVLCIFD